METKAVIDIGTNSVLMLIAARDATGGVQVVDDLVRICRLGQGVAGSGVLLPEAIERTAAALAEYRQIAQAHGARIVAVATEGLRMAKDPSPFLERARQVLGVPVRMISGDEEAELSYRSVAVEHGPGPLRVIDIGGASTELVVGRGEAIVHRRSHPIGSVRLSERFLDGDPPSRRAVEAIAAAAREAFATQRVTPHRKLHGLAGTVTTVAALLLELAQYDRDRVDGSQWSQEQVLALRDRLAVMTIAQRMQSPMLPAGRADVIVAGATILLEAMRHCGASVLVVRDRGLRYALV
ncbi:MAG: Ppx/GppA family phosphatase [Myxococcales bacterium]|nr:Ppx/GppA family phosphatase [Myxococcales bacterium]MCB9718139.1 Ppx/GppA family phosphatase [Myxococcales bacterium]